ncbi:hypothetical protein Tco_0486548, partial [Tanacetum coccineum]
MPEHCLRKCRSTRNVHPSLGVDMPSMRPQLQPSHIVLKKLLGMNYPPSS